MLILPDVPHMWPVVVHCVLVLVTANGATERELGSCPKNVLSAISETVKRPRGQTSAGLLEAGR